MLLIVVAMADSIHTARWLRQFSDQNISIILFPSTPHRRIHKEIKDIINGGQVLRLELAPLMRILSLPLSLLDTVLRSKLRCHYLKYLIQRWKPQIVHGLETQHAGYLISDSITKMHKAPQFYLSIWGSDLVWFGKFAKHRKRIAQTLTKVDFLGVECLRDIELAKLYGFNGTVLPVIPASGGLNLDLIDELGPFSQPSRRKKIMVKGYSGFVGRSLTALKALESMPNDLFGFEIHIYSASFKTIRHARRLAKRTGLEIKCHKKHSLSHASVLSLFGESRFSISVSLSDGFPGSLRESMSTGCFPIESNNSCGFEWINEGNSALFVNPLVFDEVVASIKKAISDDTLVDAAAITNRSLIEDKASVSSISRLVSSYYSVNSKHE
jgi:glycosyltransferase involved in cell wall biosynthesis